MMQVGITTVWTSPVIRKLKSVDTSINPLAAPVTTFEVALISGLLPFGGIISPLFLTKLCDIIGRKNTMIILSTVMLAAEIALAYSAHVYMYYISRFIIGVSIGGAVSAVSVFLSEISEDHNRGMIGCFIGMSFPVGNLCVYLLGPIFSVKVFTLLCAVPNIVNLFCLFTFIPESPFYLASTGDRESTIKSLERLRNKTPSQIEKEYETIFQTIQETSGKVEATWCNIFRVRSLRRGFIIAVGLSWFQEFSGICAIMAFAGPLFDASGASLSGDMIAILIGLVKFASGIFTTIVIEKVGRRPLLISSTLGGSVPLLSLGIFFYLKKNNSPIVDSISWLPIVSVLVFIITYSLGLGVIPTSIMSEIFPSNAKSKAASASTCTALTVMFLITTVFPIMNDFLGPAWCLWIFSVSNFLGFLFVYFVIPEIKGKSLVEVQELLSK